MLGVYDNFPKTIHQRACFTTAVSWKKLQQTMIKTLHEINRETVNQRAIADPAIRQYTVIFEFGIAETNDFNYLDEEETKKVLRNIQKTPLQIMDFYCAIRYYRTRKEKKTPLRFDHYLIRFTFNKNSLETQVSHERGPRYTSPQDIIDLIQNKINEKFSKKTLTPL